MIRPTCLATKWYHPRIPHRVVHISLSGRGSVVRYAYNLDKFMAASLVAGAIVKYCPWDEGK